MEAWDLWSHRGAIDRRHGALALVFLTLGALCAGCGQKKSGPVAQEQTNLAWLGHMYGMYISQNKSEAPKTIEDLRKFVEKRTNPDVLARLKVANVGELFVSPRDGKPFVLVSYAKLPPMAVGQPPPVVLYEADGQNGQRAVAFLGGNTQTMDETELQHLLPAESKLRR
jgi:hypothetical protein